MVYRHPTHGTLTPYLWYIDPLLMAYRVPYLLYIYPYHGILTLLPMVHINRPPYPWYFDPLPMIFWLPAYLLIRNEGVKIPWGFNLPYRGINIPWGSKYHMTPVLSSFMNYHRICNQINTTSTTSGARTAYLSRAPNFSPGFLWGLCYTIFSFMCMLYRLLLVLLSCFAIVLSVLRFTDSYYPFRLWYLETLLKKSCYSFPNRLLC